MAVTNMNLMAMIIQAGHQNKSFITFPWEVFCVKSLFQHIKYIKTLEKQRQH